MCSRLFKITVAFSCIIAAYMNASGQTVEVFPKITVNDDKLLFEIFVSSPSEEIVPVGNAVFEVSFNPEKLEFLGKDPELDGMWDDKSSSDYYDTFSTCIGNRAFFRILYKAGDETTVSEGVAVPTAEPARVGCMAFQLKDQFAEGDIKWMQPFCIVSDIHENKIAVILQQ